MSTDAFSRIASKHGGYERQVRALEGYLSGRAVGVAIRVETAADFVGLKPDILEALLTELLDDLIERRTCWICSDCDSPIEGDRAEDGKRECDECGQRYAEGRVEKEVCYFLRRQFVRSSPPSKGRTIEMNETGTLTDTQALRMARITPWKTLQEADYTRSITTLHPGIRNEILDLLHRFGIARLTWQGDSPSAERLLSLENFIGPARARQNDFVGKVKSLRPNFNVAPNTGDSAKALAPHVDGTQDERTPAVLAFQYDMSATWGAESTFIDMVAVLGELPTSTLERILTALARNKCATCTKKKGSWTGTFTGPLVRAEYFGQSISIRLREDDLLTVVPECQREFAELQAAVARWDQTHKLRYTPHEGDVVIFDNWRLLHGRAAIGGRHQRIHDRMWIDHLLPEYDGKYLLGIRPLDAGLMAAIQRANVG